MEKLIAELLRSDAEVIAAQKVLVDKVKEYSSKIKGILPAQKNRVLKYQEVIQELGDLRGGPLYFPYIGSGIGNGALVELDDGSVKYDFITGIGTHIGGHSHPKIIEGAIKASLEGTTMQGNLQQSKSSHAFIKKLLSLANKNKQCMDHCFLTSSGVMAGENSLKLALHKHYPAHRVFAFKKCFSGRTITFSQITDKAAYRKGLPTSLHVDYIPFFDPENPEKSIEEATQALKEYIYRYPKEHAGMFFELIIGEGGYYPGSQEFHRTLMSICKDNGIAVMADEVQTFSRTREAFAFQYYHLEDWVDIVWIGKSSQVCATLFRNNYKPAPGLISQTFTSSSTAIAVGEFVLDELAHGGYLGENGKIEKLHSVFVNELKKLSAKYKDKVKGPFGEGVMVGFTAFGGDFNKSTELVKKCFENGLMSFVAGANPTRIRFLIPTFSITEAQILEGCKILEKTLSEIN